MLHEAPVDYEEENCEYDQINKQLRDFQKLLSEQIEPLSELKK